MSGAGGYGKESATLSASRQVNVVEGKDRWTQSSKAGRGTCSNRDVSTTLGSREGSNRHVCLWGPSKAPEELSREGGNFMQNVSAEGRDTNQGKSTHKAWGQEKTPPAPAAWSLGCWLGREDGEHEPWKRSGLEFASRRMSGRQWGAMRCSLAWHLNDRKCTGGGRGHRPLVSSPPQLRRSGPRTIHSLSNWYWRHPSSLTLSLLTASNPICYPQYQSGKVRLFIVCCHWWQLNHTDTQHPDLHSICTSAISFHPPSCGNQAFL